MVYASDAAQISRYYEFSWPVGEWQYGLGLLPAAEYLERRALWASLSELAVLEHPGLLMGGKKQPNVVARVWAGEPQVHLTHIDDAYLLSSWEADQRLPFGARGVARPQILRALRDEWDALPERELSRERTRRELADSYGVPLEAIAEPLYAPAEEDGEPVGRVKALEACITEGMTDATEIEATLRERYPRLYWANDPPVEIGEWQSLCAWVASFGEYGCTTATMPEGDAQTWTDLYLGDARPRSLAYDLISGSYLYSEAISLVPWWRERLAEMERVAAALGVG
jgi:hypothetical protein